METATAISTIAPAVEQSIIARIKPHIKRALYSKSNLTSLKNQVERLKNAQTTVESLVNEAKNNLGREIHPHVEAWLKKVEEWTRADKFTQEEGNAQKKCFIGLCPNYITRYQVSVQAEVGAKDVDELLKEAGGYDATEKISRRPAAPASRLMSFRDIEPVNSRTLLLDKVIEALKDSDVNMIGVHGMGGVGKTTLIKSVAAQVLREELFNNVVISTVTAKPDVAKIQEEIAETLGVRLEEKSEKVRAIRLCDRLKQEKKILVIFDDLWKRLDLQSVGIPHPDQHKGLKILMTARDENVLSREMEAKRTFQLQVLSEDEAWNLFEKTVGNIEKDSEMGDVATKVAERCGGLPVLLVPVGKALRNASLHAWEDALKHLAKFEDTELDAQISSALGLSYKLLKEDESKSLFLLCGQQGSDPIFIRDLLAYTAGLGLIRGTNLREVRNRLYKLLDDLKASSLLLEGDDDEWVKMHDVVRNFAISVAYKDHRIFTVTDDVLREWPAKDKLEQFTAISAPGCEIPELPEVFDCPNLESLLLFQKGAPSMKIPDKLFEKTKKIKLIDLTGVHLSPLPSSLEFLENLQSLCLGHCDVEDITPIGKLSKLQVLSLLGCSLVRLPEEIGQLTRLQLLDLSFCLRLKVIPPNVLSFLTRLEDFSMRGITLEWYVEEFNSERENASLVELKPLLDLSSLEIHITDVKMLPDDLIFRKLEWFRISVGGDWDWYGENEGSRTLKLKLNTSTQLGEGLKALLKKSETLHLQGPEGVKDVPSELDKQGFSNRLVELSHCSQNLTSLTVKGCDNLSSLLTYSMVKSLWRLRTFEISDCKLLEAVIVTDEVLGGGEMEAEMLLSHLNFLNIKRLPQLVRFCNSSLLSFASLKVLWVKDCPKLKTFNSVSAESEITRANIESEIAESSLFDEKVALPKLEELKIVNMDGLKKIWHDELHEDSFVQLKALNVINAAALQNVFPPKIESKLKHLEDLLITDCDSLTELFDMSSMVATRLRKLCIERLPNLRSVFPASTVGEHLRLEELVVVDCETLDFIAMREGGDDVPLFRFSRLTRLQLFYLSSLKGFSSGRHISGNSQLSCVLEKLETLDVWGCHDLTSLAPLSASFKSLTTLDVGGCNGLLSLFTSSMAKCLQQLRRMRISECNKLTEVVATEGDGIEDGIVFSHLECLILDCLPSLTSFCSENRRFKFPSLETVVVKQCPKMRCFSVGALSTPKLQKVQLAEDTDENCWKGDLNATMQHLFTEMGQAAEQSELPSSTREPSSDPKAPQAEEDSSPLTEGPASDALTVTKSLAAINNSELEVELAAEVASGEQEARPDITQVASRYQDSDASSQDNKGGVVAESKPFCFPGLPKLDFDTAQEENETFAPSKELASEDPHVVKNLSTRKDLPPGNESRVKIKSQEQKTNNEMVEPGITRLASVNKETPETFKNEESPRQGHDCSGAATEDAPGVKIIKASTQTESKAISMLDEKETMPTDEGFRSAPVASRPPSKEAGVDLLENMLNVPVAKEPATHDQRATLLLAVAESSSTNEPYVQAVGVQGTSEAQSTFPTSLDNEILAPQATSFTRMAEQTLSAESLSGLQLSSRNLLAELSSITGIRRPPRKTGTTSRQKLTPGFENLQHQKKSLSDYLSMSLEDIQLADAFDDIERISLSLIQHSSSMQEKEDLKDFLSRLTELKRQVKDAIQMMNVAEASKSSHSMKSMDLKASLLQGQDELTTLESKFSEISEEADALEMEIRRLIAKKDTLLGVGNSIASMLEKSSDKVSKVLEEWKSLQDENREADKNWYKGKEMLMQANASWSLLKQSLRM